jgi:hypothetical protein
VLFAAVRACVSVGKTQIRVTPHGNNDELKILKNAIEHTKVPIYINRPKGPYKELFTIKSTFVSDVQRALQHESHLFGRSAVTRASVVKKSARRLRRGRKH